jgi:hypothetical protein
MSPTGIVAIMGTLHFLAIFLASRVEPAEAEGKVQRPDTAEALAEAAEAEEVITVQAVRGLLLIQIILQITAATVTVQLTAEAVAAAVLVQLAVMALVQAEELVEMVYLIP